MPRPWILLVLAIPVVACQAQRPGQDAPQTEFGHRVAVLSEPGGYFDTDNLISNERSYLHVVGELVERGVRGGAYLGVGPGQNFSYIAAIDPDVAYIIDIRRDNMLLHLLYKALFELAPHRVQYLAVLFGRPTPDQPDSWSDADIAVLVTYIDTAQTDVSMTARARQRADSAIATFGVALDSTDWRTIDRFHRTFIDAGLSLQFRSFGRAPRPFYPSYRDLFLERDLDGERRNYLVSDESYAVVRDLQLRDAVIPVVGDLAGPRALRAVGRELEGRHRVSAFYVSNVEFYLFRAGTFDRFADNVSRLPLADDAVIIRSVFQGPFGGSFSRNGVIYYSSQYLVSAHTFVEAHARGELGSYRALIRR